MTYMVKLLKKIRSSYLLRNGYKQFKQNGRTSSKAYAAMRQMFVFTRGKSNDELSTIINQSIGKYDNIKPEGVLGELSNVDLKKMVAQMKTNGYFIFDAKLDDTLIHEIYNFALREPASYLKVGSEMEYSKEKVKFDAHHPLSPRYQFDTHSIVNNSSLQQLIFDQSILAFAQEYLGCKPILDLVDFWFSVPFNGLGLSEAAQMYHFDLDRIKFIKFFFYLTDVSTETGPHCFVKGSHKRLPDKLARDGRFRDDEIEKVYGKDNLIEICGKKGSIIAVDTRGFHKGKVLTEGSRLLFQIEFANSMFGQSYPPARIKFVDDHIGLLKEEYPYTYGQILIN